MSPLLDLAGVVFGVTGLVLAVAMLLVEHREAPMLHRASVGLLGFLCLLVAVNASVAFRSLYPELCPSPVAVGFAAAVTFNWLYRLIHGRTRR